MSIPVDLSNLHSMTDGDTEMEHALFEEFYASFEAGIQAMRAQMTQPEAWQKMAHALKGIALNLGADGLAKICQHSQHAQTVPVDRKQELLAQIEGEYAQVKAFLQHLAA